MSEEIGPFKSDCDIVDDKTVAKMLLPIRLNTKEKTILLKSLPSIFFQNFLVLLNGY
jgi:hypothetical protein